MKKIISILLSIICVFVLTGCLSNPQSNSSTSEPPLRISEPSSIPSESGRPEKLKEGDTMPTVNIQVANKNFTAILYDNAATRELLAKLPLTLNMDELNGNEKLYFFPEKFPTDSEQVGNIKVGDLMLYGSDCLVVFYKSFSTSYSYTRLGYIEDVTGLAKALGDSSVLVNFSLNN